MLNEYFSVITEAAYRHEGTIFSMAGDCLLVGFNVPFPQPDAAVRAWRAAQDMVRELRAGARRLDRPRRRRHRRGHRHRVGRGDHRQHRLAAPHELHHHRRRGEHRGAPDADGAGGRGAGVRGGLRVDPRALLPAERGERARRRGAARQVRGRRRSIRSGCESRARPHHRRRRGPAHAACALHPPASGPTPRSSSSTRSSATCRTRRSRSARYDVVILDYMLGRGDGLRMAAAASSSAPTARKILFLTGAGNEIIAVRAMKAGADDYQRKQELTRERLVDVAPRADARRPPRRRSRRSCAARMEGQSLGARIRIPGIKRAAPHRRGRHVARVPRLARERRRAAGGEDPAPRGHLRPAGAGALHGGVRAGRAHPEPARGAHLRPRHLGGARLPGDGVLRGRRPQQAPGRQARCRRRGAAAVPRADVRAGRHPREGHPAPRPQAAEPDVPQRRQPRDRGLRHRQAHRRRRPHRPRRDPRHAALHEPGAGAGAGARPAHRHLQRRRAAVPDAHRPAPLRGRDRGRSGAAPPQHAAAAAAGAAWRSTSG